jgi:choline dehydrogenase-like flavoprotein
LATGTTEIVVIGGGISGTAAAYELARAGAKVTLLERGSLASMASGWTLAGVRQSGRHPAELPLATAAVARWEQLGEELGADVEYRREGNLRLARSLEEAPSSRLSSPSSAISGWTSHISPTTPPSARSRRLLRNRSSPPRTARPMATPTPSPRCEPSPAPPHGTGRECERKPW